MIGTLIATIPAFHAAALAALCLAAGLLVGHRWGWVARDTRPTAAETTRRNSDIRLQRIEVMAPAPLPRAMRDHRQPANIVLQATDIARLGSN